MPLTSQTENIEIRIRETQAQADKILNQQLHFSEDF